MHTRPTFHDEMYKLLTKGIIIRNPVIFLTSKSHSKSADKVDESKQRLHFRQEQVLPFSPK